MYKYESTCYNSKPDNMKPMKKFLGFALILSLMESTSCSKKEEGSLQISEIITNGTWKVNFYTKSNVNRTNDFSGYLLTFGKDGYLTAASSDDTTIGFWGWDETDKIFSISIGTMMPLEQLTDHWIIKEKSEKSVKIKNRNSLKDEELDFIKN